MINSDIHWSVSISAIGLIGFIITFSFNLWIGSTCFPENDIDRFLMVLIGITSFFAHIGKVLIGRLENAASGALLNRSFDVIVTFLGQFIFFQVKISQDDVINMSKSSKIFDKIKFSVINNKQSFERANLFKVLLKS